MSTGKYFENDIIYNHTTKNHKPQAREKNPTFHTDFNVLQISPLEECVRYYYIQ